MAIFSWETLPTFDTGQPLSYADLNLWRNNALLLDAATLRGRRALTDQIDYLHGAGLNPSPLFRGAFQFRTGVTTLTIVVVATIPGSTHTLRTFLNGDLVTPVNSTVLTTGTTTVTVTLIGRGFNNGDVIDVDIDISRSSGSIGTYALKDCYISPYSGTPTGAYPGVPTFGAISATNLNQLTAAAEWLRERVRYVAQPAPMGVLYRSMNAHGPSTRSFWRGSIARSNGASTLECTIGYTNLNTIAEKMHLYIDGVLVASTGTITSGQVGAHTFSVSLSGYTNEQVLQLELIHEVITVYNGRGQRGTRWNLRWAETSIPSPTYATPPALSTVRESLTFSQLQSRLNAIAAIYTAVKNRVDAAADTFDRVRVFRAMPINDAYALQLFRSQLVPRGIRRFDALVVKGKGVKLHWGQLKVERNDDVAWEWETTWSQEVTGNEAMEIKVVALDMLEGFVPGTFYYVQGEDVRFVGEVVQ